MASGLHESSGLDLNTFLDEASGMASSGAAAAPPRAHNQWSGRGAAAAAAAAVEEEDTQDQPGEGECGVGEWDQAEQERIMKKCCPEICILKDGGKCRAPWHRFVPVHKNIGPHYVCELCVVKNGKKRQATEEHLASTEHINRIGKGDNPSRSNLMAYERDHNIRI